MSELVRSLSEAEVAILQRARGILTAHHTEARWITNSHVSTPRIDLVAVGMSREAAKCAEQSVFNFLNVLANQVRVEIGDIHAVVPPEREGVAE